MKRTTWRSIAFFSLMLWTISPDLRAQSIDSAAVRATPSANLAIAGMVAGAAGVVGGIYMGAALERSFGPCNCDDPGLIGALLGAYIGPALLVPFGVTIANEQPGNLGKALSTSLLIGGGGVVLTLATGGRGVVLIPVLPVLETITSIRAQRQR